MRATHKGAPKLQPHEEGTCRFLPPPGAVVRVYSLDGCMAHFRTPIYAARVLTHFEKKDPNGRTIKGVTCHVRELGSRWGLGRSGMRNHGSSTLRDFPDSWIHYSPKRGWEVLK